MPPDLSVLHLEKRTVRALPADHLRETRNARTVRKHCATKINILDGSNHERARTSDELNEHKASRTVRAYQDLPNDLSS
jgi:hypothetical protein